MSFFLRLCLLVLLFALPDAGAHAQSAPFTLYLAGDGGAATSVDGTPALAMLRDSLAACEASCGVLFLGDNVYTSGLAPEGHPDRDRGEQILDAQIEVARLASGPAVFLPGNHDSGGGGVGGDLRRLRNMEQYVIERLGEQSFLPRGGHPGPVVLHPHPTVALIIINSQWWFEADHRSERTGRQPESSRRDIVALIDTVVQENDGRHVILATHHPVRSAGDHALYSLGFSPIALARRVLGAPQDYSDRHYQRYRHDILSIAERHPDLIIVSGHEHNLTYFDSPGHHVVSGSLSKPEWASERTGATFASGDAGFAALRFTDDGRAHLTFSAVDDHARPRLLFERRLAAIGPTSALDIQAPSTTEGDFDPPPPSFEIHAAPRYDEWRGAGAEAYIRYTIPDTRIRPRFIAESAFRYDVETRGIAGSAGFYAAGSSSELGVRIAATSTGRIEALTSESVGVHVRHHNLSVEPYVSRYSYGGMLGVTASASLRYHKSGFEDFPSTRLPIDEHAIPSITVGVSSRMYTLDSEVLPEGGIDLNLGVQAIIYDDRQAALRLEGGFRFFRSFGFRRPLTTAFGTHAMMITGDPPFYDLANAEGVRGYAPLGWTGRGSIISSLELRQVLFHLDHRAIRPAGILGFFDTGVLFPMERPYGPPTRDGWRPVKKGNPLVNASIGAGVWANISRRVVMNAILGSGENGRFVRLGQSFHF